MKYFIPHGYTLRLSKPMAQLSFIHFLCSLYIITCSTVVFAATPISISVGENHIIDIIKSKSINVQVVSPNIIEVKKFSPTKLAFRGLKIGKTRVKIWDNNGYQAEYLVKVEIENVAKSKVSELIEQMCPEGNVKFTLTPSSDDNEGKLILQGRVPTKARGERLEKLFTALDYTVVNMLTIEGSQQVQLFVRVAEVVKGNPMSVGITLGGKSDGWLISSPGKGILATLTGAINSGEIRSNALDTFHIGANFSGASWFGVLSLMEGHRLAKILAQPTLVVESGQSARFHAGGEIPTPVDSDNYGITIEWKAYGIILAFTPEILENGNIHIDLEQEVSTLDWANGVSFGAGTIPAMRTRTTKTSVKLRDGESFVVSGLLHEEIRSIVDKIPLLGDIPIFGALFRSSSYEKDQSELAIVVTPRIINPIAANEAIVLPGEQLTTPSPFDAFLLGKIVAKTDTTTAATLLGTAGLEMP